MIADEALKLGVIDMVADNRSDLISKLDGRRVTRAGLDVVLQTKSADLIEWEESFRDKFLKTLADPNILLYSDDDRAGRIVL